MACSGSLEMVLAHIFFSALQPGDYTISISYIGFEKLRKVITINPGTSISVTCSSM